MSVLHIKEKKMGNYRTEKFDKALKEFHHYQKHPQMIPFVGKYWGEHKKLLVVGESHYLPPESKIDAKNNWYNIDADSLSFDEKLWTSTALLLDQHAGTNQHYESKGHMHWKNIELAILESGFHPADTTNMFSYIAFMDFFQRPSQITGESIDNMEKDNEIANETLQFVQKVIQFDYLFFTSSKAWEEFDEDILEKSPIDMGYSSHPACHWWNIKTQTYYGSSASNKMTGKESFIHFLQKNKILETV